MLSSFSESLPLGHELLGGRRDVQPELIPEEINQALLVEDQGNVVDGWTVVNVDYLNNKDKWLSQIRTGTFWWVVWVGAIEE